LPKLRICFSLLSAIKRYEFCNFACTSFTALSVYYEIGEICC